MSVKRYLAKISWTQIETQEHPAGEFVLWSDYAALLAATQWRPIETAPKDGTEVLLFLEYTECDDGAGRKSTHIDRCYWSDAEKGWGGYATSIRNGYTTPTHWMPLPKPPSV